MENKDYMLNCIQSFIMFLSALVTYVASQIDKFEISENIDENIAMIVLTFAILYLVINIIGSLLATRGCLLTIFSEINIRDIEKKTVPFVFSVISAIIVWFFISSFKRYAYFVGVICFAYAIFGLIFAYYLNRTNQSAPDHP